jgi:vacuolar protein sorting-associated protein 45
LLFTTLDTLAKGKLKDSTYPAALPGTSPNKPTEVVIFIVGGVTFEEALRVSEFNANTPGMRFILGGSCIHNSRSFLDEIRTAF